MRTPPRFRHRPHSVIPVRLFPLLLTATFLSALLPSCAGRTTERSGPQGYTRSTTMLTDRDQALLERGRQARAEGNWSEALESFTTVRANSDAKPEYRQQALYEQGMLYSDLLNPGKDFNKAIGFLQRLISEYPDSDLRPKAETQISRLQALQAPSQK